MNKLIKLLITTFLVLTPSITLAQSGPNGQDHKTLDGARREWDTVSLAVMTSSSPTTMIVGRGGGLVDFRPSTVTTGFTFTTTIGAMPYAATVAVRHEDLGAATVPVLSCSNVRIQGYDQFGVERHEDLGTVAETYVSTRYAYDRITAIITSGCNYGAISDSSDRFRAIVGRGIGVRNTIRHPNDILSLCYDRDGGVATGGLLCAPVVASTFGGKTVYMSAVTPVYAPYNLITIPGTVGAAENNSAGSQGAFLFIRTRSNIW